MGSRCSGVPTRRSRSGTRAASRSTPASNAAREAIVYAGNRAKFTQNPALLAQLAPEGALVCPIRRVGGEHLVRVRKGVSETLAAVRFVPLVSDE